MGDRVGPGYEPVNDLPKVQIEKTSKMYLRQIIASGKTVAGEEFEVYSVIPDASIMVSILKDGKTQEQYLLLMKKVVDAVLDYREKKAGETPALPEEVQP